MKKNKVLSLAVAAVMACGANMAYGQAYEKLTLTPEAEQAAKMMIENFKNNPDDLLGSIKKATKQFKIRKKEDLIAIGAYCYKQKEYSPAISLAQQVYEDYYDYLPSLHLEGDCYMDLQRYGEAAQKFEEARSANEKDKYAYFRIVDVYKYINPDHALNLMEQVKEKYPNDPAIGKTMASIYYFQNDTANANAAYSEYFKNVNFVDDADAATEYAIVRFLNKDFKGSLDVVNAIIDKRPDEIALSRMKFYDLLELGQYAEAHAAAEKFFGKFIDTLYNYNDYKYMGALQLQRGDKAKAGEALEKSLKMMPEDKGLLFKELSDNLKSVGKYDAAVEAYQKYIDKEKPGSIPEMIKKGRIYYTALNDTAVTDLETKKHYIAAGDEIFKVVSDSVKESYQGPYWRARLHMTLDPENAVEEAMEQYTEAFNRLEGKSADYDGIRIECLRYMMFYYLKKDDYDNCAVYVNKVLALDADDSLAKQIKAALSQLKK